MDMYRLVCRFLPTSLKKKMLTHQFRKRENKLFSIDDFSAVLQVVQDF